MLKEQLAQRRTPPHQQSSMLGAWLGCLAFMMCATSGASGGVGDQACCSVSGLCAAAAKDDGTAAADAEIPQAAAAHRRGRVAMSVLQGNETDRPLHVVIVLADDLGWGDLGSFHGGAASRLAPATPYMDALMREGVRLTQMHVWPVCSPTRSALLTGRYPSRFGGHSFVANAVGDGRSRRASGAGGRGGTACLRSLHQSAPLLQPFGGAMFIAAHDQGDMPEFHVSASFVCGGSGIGIQCVGRQESPSASLYSRPF